jgi:hypothetical protein
MSSKKILFDKNKRYKVQGFRVWDFAPGSLDSHKQAAKKF